MRKLHLLFIIVITTFLLGNTSDVMLNPDYCSIPTFERSATDGNDYILCDDSVIGENDTPSYLDTRDYREIYKKDGVWYGVLDVTTSALETITISGTGTVNYFYIDFDRDTQLLTQIDVEYTTKDTCKYPGLSIDMFGCFLGLEIPGETKTIQIYNKTLDDFFTTALESGFTDWSYKPIYPYHDSLTVIGDFDYTIEIRDVEISSIDVLSFLYVLENYEVDQVNEDIQTQFDNEVQAIMHDDSLNITEKQLAYDQLKIEYSEYTLTYDEEIYQLCVDDPECHIDNIDPSDPTEPDRPLWVEDIIETVIQGVGIIVASIVGTSLLGMIAYMIVRKGITITGEVSWTTIKGGVKSGTWIGSRIGYGVLAILEVIWNGIKSIGWWNLAFVIPLIIFILLI